MDNLPICPNVENVSRSTFSQRYFNVLMTCAPVICYSLPWSKIKTLFVTKMDAVIHEFREQSPMDDLPICPNVENVKFEEMKKRLHRCVERFLG